MSYSENGGGVPVSMNVVPSGYGNDGGFGFGGNGMWWLIVLLLFMNNGWGFLKPNRRSSLFIEK